MLVGACVSLGCSDTSPKSDAIPPPPAGCAALPTLAEIQPKLVAALDEDSRDATILEPQDANVGGVIPLGIGYALDGQDADGSVVWGAGPLLLRSRADVEANKKLKGFIEYFDVDWSKEALLIVREHTREAMYRYVLAGDELVVLVAKATPCLADVESESFSESLDRGTRALRVPNTALTARMQTTEMRYRLVSPSAIGTCRRAEAPAALGGVAPSVVRGPAGVRLYFGGFSAMTGNVFFGESTDGKTFTPNGWDQDHLSKFAGRNSHYADVYEPFVEHVGEGFRMTATTNDFEVVREDKRSLEVALTGLVEMTSSDGVAWSEGKALFPPTKDAEPARVGPTRITIGDEERLYYAVAGTGTIRVARRRAGADFVEDEAPVLGPSAHLDAYDALGYGAPGIARVGSRLVLFTTVRWGGLSKKRPWRSGIAYAVSDDDGATFRPGPSPLLVPESEDEASGLGSPSALVTGDEVSLFFTAINRRAEPVVKRADCTLP